MKTVEIRSAQGAYPITIGAQCLEQAAQHLTGKAVVVTDSNVAKLHLDKLTRLLPEHRVIVVPAGEQSKSQTQLGELYDRFADYGLSRKDTVIALGGGVVGDLTGFAAATYMRGVNYLALPTTLLAMVDSSVGGKVAVNHPSGKNLIGTFFQPCAVVADTSLLSTLDARQMACGWAEVIKYACIADAGLFEALKSPMPLEQLVETCVKTKERYVQQDTFDKGIRMMLNFGHTIGHGVENGCGYGEVLHGEAVAIGMVAESRLGERMGITKKGTSEQICALCEAYRLPTQLPKIDRLREIIAHDKKSEGGGVTLALIEQIGQGRLAPITLKELENLL